VTSAQANERRTAPLEEPWSPGPALWLAGTRRCTVLAAVPAATRSAREFTAAALGGWQLDALIQDAVMIASELAANAIRHAAPAAAGAAAVELAWWHRADMLTCVVTDASSDPPVLAAPDLGAETGRGLQIVDALAAAWGWTLLGDNEKAVWAALRLPQLP
jgi:anti-sigma regulatory factor (Ser/Thr protein kinase)